MRALLALLVLLLPVASAAPSQVHLGISEDPATGLSVHWLDTQPDPAPSVVLREVGGEERTVAGRASTGPSAGFAYEATLDDLKPGTSYEYVVGGRTFPFRTPTAAAAPFRLAAIGDMGVGPRAADAVATIEKAGVDLVLHAGDLSYAHHAPTIWSAWFDLIEPVAASKPWVTAMGNHEVTLSGIGDEGTDNNAVDPVELAFYHQRFGLPNNEKWYGFDWQGVHFVALDTFSEPRMPRAEQLAWLRADLEAHKDATWTIVFLHEPPYSSNAAHGSSPRAQEAFVPLFDEFGVDLVITAHDHAYERTHPMSGGARDAAGTIYLVTGGGGNGLYPDFVDNDWSAVQAAEYHVVVLDIAPDRIDGRAVGTEDGAVLDTFTLTKAGVPGAVVEPVADEVSATPGLLVVALLAGVALARARTRRG